MVMRTHTSYSTSEMKCTTVRRGLTTFPIIFLLVFFVTDVDSFSAQVPSPGVAPTNPSKDISKSILEGLRSSPPNLTAKLDLETDFYDASTGLCSEGVWHNCLMGVASLELGQHDEALQIAKSLWKYSWDGTSFRRRSWSGNWDHSNLMDNSNKNPPVQADYYRESAEHRCVQHGMALCFWSRLARAIDDESIRAQQRQIADQFFTEFWNQDTDKWTTVSQSQGSGSILRPSASANKRTLGATEDVVYYRVVDQAIAVLACLEHMKVLQENQDENGGFASVRDIVQHTCRKGILEDFRFQNLDAARTYMHLDRNRNFWHEGWAAVALVQAREYIWPDDDDHGASQLEALCQGVLARYEHLTEGESDGMIWHWATADKEPSQNVRYCGDNALAFSIRRNLGLSDEGGFWDFIKTLRKDNEKGLSSVADVYPQVRLHPNTELAALVLWP
jgi:hypothetical protein